MKQKLFSIFFALALLLPVSTYALNSLGNATYAVAVRLNDYQYNLIFYQGSTIVGQFYNVTINNANKENDIRGTQHSIPSADGNGHYLVKFYNNSGTQITSSTYSSYYVNVGGTYYQHSTGSGTGCSPWCGNISISYADEDATGTYGSYTGTFHKFRMQMEVFSALQGYTPWYTYNSRNRRYSQANVTMSYSFDITIPVVGRYSNTSSSGNSESLRSGNGNLDLLPARGNNGTISTSVNNASYGSVSGGGYYTGGTEVSLTATSNSGYRFYQWSDGNIDNPRTITVDGDASYAAEFRAITPTGLAMADGSWCAIKYDNANHTVISSQYDYNNGDWNYSSPADQFMHVLAYDKSKTTNNYIDLYFWTKYQQTYNSLTGPEAGSYTVEYANVVEQGWDAWWNATSSSWCDIVIDYSYVDGYGLCPVSSYAGNWANSTPTATTSFSSANIYVQPGKGGNMYINVEVSGSPWFTIGDPQEITVLTSGAHGNVAIVDKTHSNTRYNTSGWIGPFFIENQLDFIAEPETGYHFTGWTWNGQDNGTDNPMEWTIEDGDKDDHNVINISASFAANTYTITLNNQSATTAGTASVTATYNASTNLTSAITKPTKTGFDFGGYYTGTNGSGTQIIDANGSFIASAGGGSTYTDGSRRWKYANDIILYAKWSASAPTTHTLTLDVTGNGTVTAYSENNGEFVTFTNNEAEIEHEDEIVITYTPAAGYHVGTHTDSEQGTFDSGDGIFMEGDHTITVTFEPDVYTITYKDQGDVAFTGTQTDAPTSHTYGTATTLKIPTKDGYNFGGWFTASDCQSGAVGNTTSASLGATDYTANITLYAKWEVSSHIVTRSVGANGTLAVYNVTASADVTFTNNTAEVADGTTLRITATANTGYHLNTLTVGGNNFTSGNTHSLTGDVTIAATFAANTNTAYTVKHYQQNLALNGYTEVEGDRQNLTGTTATATAAAAKSYTGFTAQSFEQGTIAADGLTVVSIYYNRDKYTVTVAKNENAFGTLSGESDNIVSVANVPYGTVISTGTGDNANKVTINGTTVTATKNANDAQYTYTFNNWTNGTATVTGNTTVTANFTRTVNQYTVTWKSENGESTLETDADQNYGTATAFNSTTPTKDATAQYTYTFDGWATSANGDLAYANGETPNVSGDATYYAHFSSTLKQYTVTWKNGETTLETDENVAYGATPAYNGATPTKDATAEYTYAFNGWTPAVATVTTDATYTAAYSQTKVQYTLTWNFDGGTTATAEGNYTHGLIDWGTAITAPANPTKDGYTFNGWNTTPAATMPAANVTYTAQWISAAPPVVLLDNEPNTHYNTFKSTYDGAKGVVVTYERQFTEGRWSTLCLPFSVNKGMFSTLNFGSRIYEFKYAEGNANDGSGVNLYFSIAKSIEAGKGYIVNADDKLAKRTSFTFLGVNIDLSKDNGAELSSVTAYDNLTGNSSDGNIELVGTLRKGTLKGTDKDNRYMGLKNNKIYYPNITTGSTILAYRGIFRSKTGTLNAERIRIIVDGEEKAELEVINGELQDVQETKKFIENGVLYIERNGIIYDATGRKVE